MLIECNKGVLKTPQVEFETNLCVRTFLFGFNPPLNPFAIPKAHQHFFESIMWSIFKSLPAPEKQRFSHLAHNLNEFELKVISSSWELTGRG